MLVFRNLSKKYGTNLVLKISELNIPEGTFWIEGGNGSGKTTFLKIIAGICPFEGAVSWRNIDLKRSPIPYRKGISYAEAEPLFPPSLTGWELVQFVQDTRKADPLQVAALIDRFSIRSFLGRPVGGYSSGMVKKLSILLASIGQQELILLDEPLITLDVDFVALLLSFIKEKQAAGISFLITSHQAFEATALTVNGKISVQDQSVKLDLY